MVRNFELILLALLWITQATWQTLKWVYWIQVKEYRFDRFLVLFRTKTSASALNIFLITIKCAAILLGYMSGFLIIPIISLAICNVLFLKEIYEKRIRKPVTTQRAQKILVTSLIVILFTLYLLYSSFSVLSLFVGEALIIFATLIGVIWTLPFVLIAKSREVQRAKSIIHTTSTVVIGVTGSYGKTTTKEFLSSIFSVNGESEKTVANENTEFGVARRIINSFKQSAKYFVVEMGAYKIGEIKNIANIVKPRFGIITGIEPQHLVLFGNVGNIMKAKYELVQGLQENGVAVLNYGNKHCREMASWAKRDKRVEVYGYLLRNKDNSKLDADFISHITRVTSKQIIFTVKTKTEKHEFVANFQGKHFIENLTGAIAVAKLAGLSWNEIKKGVNNATLPQKTMQIIEKNTNTTIIDDSYNSTPASFTAALDYLKETTPSAIKIVVTPGIIELGSLTEAIHKTLGTKMSSFVDYIVLTNAEMESYIQEGVKTKKTKVLIINDTPSWNTFLHNVGESKKVILIEGRVPETIRKEII